MSTYESFRTDPKLEQEGIELDLGEAGQFQLARAGGANKRYQKRLQALMRPHRRLLQAGELPEEVAQKVLAQVYAECIILDWENVTGPDGEELKFSVENCVRLMLDLPDLFVTVRATAEDATLYRQVIREVDAGN